MTKVDLAKLITEVEARSTNIRSDLHGPQHWRCVSKTGLQLAAAVPGADPLIAFLFGLFHDSCRLNDDDDPQHGSRGAELAISMARDGQLVVPESVLKPLVLACRTHTGADPTADPVIGVCYDADRLHLWRVGVRPDPRFLSTAVAKTLIAATADLHAAPLTWGEVLADYPE